MEYIVLEVDVQSRFGIQVQTVNGIKVGDTERSHETIAKCIDSLLLNVRRQLGHRGLRQEPKRLSFHALSEVFRNFSGRLELADIERHPGLQRSTILCKVERRSPNGADQRQEALEDPLLFCVRRRPRQDGARLIQVDAEPGEETVSQSVNFSIPGSRAQRNRIQIVENDFPPLSPRVRSRMIYAEACAHHLPKLVGGGIGSAAVGVS